MRPPGLLFIVNSLGVGGAEKQVITLLNHLPPGRFRLHLAYLKRIEAQLPLLDRSRLETLVCCDIKRGIERRAVLQLREIIETHHIDALVCTNTYSMLYGFLARRATRQGRPKLATVFHTTLLRTLKEHVQMLLYTRLFKRSDLLV